MKALSLDRLLPARESRASLSNIFLVWGGVAGGAAWLGFIYIYPVGLLAIAYGFVLRPTRRRFIAALLALGLANWLSLYWLFLTLAGGE